MQARTSTRPPHPDCEDFWDSGCLEMGVLCLHILASVETAMSDEREKISLSGNSVMLRCVPGKVSETGPPWPARPQPCSVSTLSWVLCTLALKAGIAVSILAPRVR